MCVCGNPLDSQLSFADLDFNLSRPLSCVRLYLPKGDHLLRSVAVKIGLPLYFFTDLQNSEIIGRVETLDSRCFRCFDALDKVDVVLFRGAEQFSRKGGVGFVPRFFLKVASESFVLKNIALPRVDFIAR